MILSPSEIDDKRTEWVDAAVERLAKLPAEMSLEEAGPFLRAADAWQMLHEDFKWIRRFMLGEATRRVKAQTPHGEITPLLKRIESMFSININTLRYAVGAAEALDGNLRKFDRFLRTGPQKRWKDIKRFTSLKIDMRELGVDELLDEIVYRAESFAEDLSEINDAEELRRAEPAAQRVMSEVERFRQDSRAEHAERHREEEQAAGREEPSTPAERGGEQAASDPDDPSLMAFRKMVACMPCAGCGQSVEEGLEGVKNDPHHLAPSATAKKQSEWALVPLCRKCHQFLHGPNGGYAAFEERYDVNLGWVVASVLHRWIHGTRLRAPAGLNGAPRTRRQLSKKGGDSFGDGQASLPPDYSLGGDFSGDPEN